MPVNQYYDNNSNAMPCTTRRRDSHGNDSRGKARMQKHGQGPYAKDDHQGQRPYANDDQQGQSPYTNDDQEIPKQGQGPYANDDQQD